MVELQVFAQVNGPRASPLPCCTQLSPRSVSPSVLPVHALVIAAIFVPYMGSMGGLIAYACWTGRERRPEEPEHREDDPGPAVLLKAA